MARRHFVISYDIADDKRRTKVFRILNDYGDHAQFSVFFCELNNKELASLRAYFTEIIKPTEDQIMILDLGTSEKELLNRLDCIGKRFEPPVRVIVI